MRGPLALTLALLWLLAVPAHATTLYVDPAQADGVTKFLNLNQAAEYLVNNNLNTDGQADTISILVDTLTVGAAPDDGGVLISGTDDFTLEGDGDANGTWCTVLVSQNDFNGTALGDGAFIRIQNADAVAWTGQVLIRNLILAPSFQAVNTATSVVTRALACNLGSNVGTAGGITLENLVVTGTGAGNVIANPFSATWNTTNTRWGADGFLYNKATASASANKTALTVRNAIFSNTTGSATGGSLAVFGANTNYVFGPGFVSTNGIAYALFCQTTITDSTVTLAGTPGNRNLIYNMGLTGNTRHVINADGGTGTNYPLMAYTDLIGGIYARGVRLNSNLALIDNCLFANGDANVGYLNVALASNQRTLSNCTFFNVGTRDTSGRQISDGVTRNWIFSNVIFAAGNNEAVNVNATCDRIDIRTTATLAYCLFPESGPNKLHTPYGTTFPPSPVSSATYLANAGTYGPLTFDAGCTNVDPQFKSTSVADYPVPGSIAAWQAAKIALDPVKGFLLPTNDAALLGTGPAGKNLHGVWTSYDVPVELAGFSVE